MTVIRFDKGVHTPFAKHFTFRFTEGSKWTGGYPLLHNRVSAIVARFQMEEGCSSLFAKQFQLKSAAKFKHCRDAPPSRKSSHPWYLLTQHTWRNVHLFYRTPFHKSSNILLDTEICICFAKSISSQMLYRSSCFSYQIFDFRQFWPPHCLLHNTIDVTIKKKILMFKPVSLYSQCCHDDSRWVLGFGD